MPNSEYPTKLHTVALSVGANKWAAYNERNSFMYGRKVLPMQANEMTARDAAHSARPKQRYKAFSNLSADSHKKSVNAS